MTKQEAKSHPGRVPEVPTTSAEASRDAGGHYIQACEHDHDPSGECIPKGGHPFENLVEEYREGKRTIDEPRLTRELRDALAPFVQLIEAACVETPEGLAIENMFDASRISQCARNVSHTFLRAASELNAAHAKTLPGQPHVYFWSPVEDREHTSLAGAIDKVNHALMWPVDRHNEDMAKYGGSGDRFRVRDVISFHHRELLRSALRTLELIATAKLRPAKSKRKPGRPPASESSADERVEAAWRTGRYPRYADLEREMLMKPGEARRALDRLRHRREREK